MKNPLPRLPQIIRQLSRVALAIAAGGRAGLVLLVAGAAFTSPAQSNQCATVASGLIGWWAAEGNAADFTGEHAGSFPYGSAFAGGTVGQAFDFDGSYRRVSIADSPEFQLTNAMTLEAWVYPRAYGGFITFRGDNRGGLDNWTVDTYESGFVKFSLIDPDNNVASVRAALALNQWQHIAATWDRASGDLKIYVNGALGGQTNSPLVPIGVLDGGSEPAIGIGNHGGTFHQFPFNGMIDELGIYNRALTASEVALIFTANSAGKCQTTNNPPPSNCVTVPEGVVSWWRAENNPLDEIHTNSGTLVGGMGYTAGRVGQAFAFDGVDDGVLIPDAELLNVGPGQDFTVEAWIQAEPHATEYGVMSILSKRVAPTLVNAHGFELALHYGKLGAQLADEDDQFQNFISAGPDLIDGAYHHVAMTVNRVATNGGQLFVDGQVVLVFDPTAQSGNLGTSAPLRIGKHASDWFNGSFKGRVDEVAFYRRALEVGEIAAIYQAGSLGKCASPSNPPPPPPPVTCTNLPVGIISWWRGENNFSDSIRSNHGSAVGGVSFVPGKVGMGMRFDGVSHVVIPHDASLDCTNALTIELWYRPDAGYDASYGLIDKRVGAAAANYGINNSSFAGMGVYYDDATVLDGDDSAYGSVFEASRYLPSPASGVFHHLAATFLQIASNTVQLETYIDGEKVRTKLISGNLANTLNSTPVTIGATARGAGEFFKGVMDEVAIYNRQLDAHEIAKIFLADSAGKCAATNQPPLVCTPAASGLVAWWRGENNGLDSISGSASSLLDGMSFGVGQVGQAFQFDGENDAIRVTAGPVSDVGLHPGFTFEAWIKPSRISIGQIAEWNDGGSSTGVHLWHSVDTVVAGDGVANLYANLVDTAGVSHALWSPSGLVALNTYNHVALTYDKASGLAVLFHNGVAVKTNNLGSFTPQTSYDLYFGKRASGPFSESINHFQGTMDEVSLYSRALSGQEIAAIYNAGSAGKCSSVTNPPPLVCTPPASGLVSWWRAEENVLDTFGHAPGALIGAATFAEGRVGRAFNVNGDQGSLVQISDALALNLTNELTFEAWINVTAHSANDAVLVVGKDAPSGVRQYMIGLVNSGGKWVFRAHLGLTSGFMVIDGTAAVLPGNWYHVALTYDGSQFRSFVNGILDASLSASGAIVTSASPLLIGGFGVGPWNFNGRVDEVSLYNRALIPNEIAAIYNAGSAGKCAPTFLAPLVTQQPQSVTTNVSATVRFEVAATGVPAPAYQWFFGNAPLAYQTNAGLILSNVQLAQAGSYLVQVSNIAGVVFSSNAVLSIDLTQPASLVDATSMGFYNDSLGTTLDGTAPQFPLPFGAGGGDPEFYPADEPNLAAGAAILGNWLTNPSSLNSYWRSVTSIPTTWELNTETAIIYVVDGGYHGVSNLRADIDADNGIYVWVNGKYKFGARQPGLPSPLGQYEYTNVYLGELAPGSNYIQILREDSGIADGYQFRLRGTVLATNQVPIITQSPATQTVAGGNTVTFNAAAIGSPDLTFQWQLNGVALTGQSNNSLTLANVLLSQAGEYTFVATNPYGAATSAVATLTVLAFPPVITRQPTNVTAIETTAASFSVQATGSVTLAYQWLLNELPLAGKTTATLAFSSVQFSNAGDYSVIITNPYGAVTSAVATLVVKPRPLCVPVPAGLVSWWRAENNTLDGWDSNNGPTQTSGYRSGKVGQAFSFVSLAVPDSASLAFTNELTIEAWINPSTISGFNLIPILIRSPQFAQGGSEFSSSYLLGLTNQNRLFFSVGVTGLTSAQTIPVNAWTHVAASYSAATGLRLFINGQLVSSRASTAGIPLISGTTYIGAAGISGRVFGTFPGGLDEVSLYQRALDATEIQSIVAADLTGKCLAPPVITQQPQDQAVPLGEDVKLTATVVGSRPLTYRWKFNGNNILNATNAFLIVEKVKATNAGLYTLAVSNSVGFDVSAPAEITLLPAPACTEILPGLISWWTGDASLRDVMELNHITSYTPASYPTGKVAAAFTFNGVTSRVQVNNSASLNFTNNKNFSIEMWIKANVTNTLYPNVPLLEKRDTLSSGWKGYSLSLYGGQLAFALGAAGVFTNAVYVSSGPDLRDGMFHHVAVTLDRAASLGGVLYVDGAPVLVFDPRAFTNSLGNTAPLYLGGPATTFLNSYFSGLIDEPAIYNRALTAAEILSIRTAGAAGRCKAAPLIITQPVGGSVALGSNFPLTVVATGIPAPRYQWRKGTTPVAGATNATLLLTNFSAANAGAYTVVVSNAFGTVISSNAVVGRNLSPIANADALTTPSNTPAVFPAAKLALNDTDAEGDPLTVTTVSASSAQNGTVSLAAGLVTYSPRANFVGNDTFTYTIADGRGGTASGTVMATVGNGGAAPLNIVFGPTLDGGQFAVRFAGIPGLTYTIQAAPTPNGPWSKVANLTAPSTDTGFGIGVFEFREPVTGESARYYRTVYPSY